MKQKEINIEIQRIKKIARSISFLWLFILFSSLMWNLYIINNHTKEIAKSEARANFNKDQAIRFWATEHGGVYVPINKRTPANPSLSHIPDRNIVKPSGDTLTLMNPAYMIRQMFDEFPIEYGAVGRIVSLKPLNPNNAADEWERKALLGFEKGEKERFEFTVINGEEYLRLIQPMITKEGCLKCHAFQGYNVGDIRGGVGVSIKMTPLLIAKGEQRNTLFFLYLLIMVTGFVGIWVGFKHYTKRIEEKLKADKLLNKSEEKVSSLSLEINKRKKTESLLKEINNKIEIRNEELKIAKEKAEDNQKLYKDLVQSSHNLIWKCDIEGKFTFLNSAWENTHGYKVEEMLGRPFSDFQRPEVFERDIIEFTRHLEGGFVKGYETTHITKDGTEIPLIFNALPLYNATGEIIGTQGTAFDISKLKQTEIELIKAKEKAEESDRLKSAFLANMSHEIRTPMNGILGFAELLKEPNLTGKEQQKYIQIIEKGGARMLNIINDIISISKIESGQMDVTISDSNINEQIEYIYTFFKPEVEAKGMQLSFKNMLPVKEATIKTDREKLFAILTNLVKNAIKYSEKGSIEIGYDKKGEHLEFYVKDSGIGIESNRKEAIFERFIQADIEDKMARQGAGLGLSISKAYVELLGGKLWVESEKGIGSIFYFTIPYTTELLKTDGITNSTADDVMEAQVKNLKILIVEDDETSDLLLSTMLTKINREILQAKNGLEAIELCRNNPDLDLILMDIKMPVMDGYEATQQIRKFNKDVIIIAQTAFGLSSDREKAIESGCNDYISKPINKTELLALIQKHFKK